MQRWIISLKGKIKNEIQENTEKNAQYNVCSSAGALNGLLRQRSFKKELIGQFVYNMGAKSSDSGDGKAETKPASDAASGKKEQ